MKSRSKKYITRIAQYCTCLLLTFLSTSELTSQSCDFTTGPVSIDVSGGNQTDQYSTIYVLTDIQGFILAMNENAASFEVLEQGFYVAYAINFRNGTTVSGLNIGDHIDFISADDCFDVGSPYGFTVCSQISNCNYCLGETVELTSTGGNTSAGFTTRYVLTDNRGIILQIEDEPTFIDVEDGLFLAFPINYETGKPIVGLEIGRNIADLQSGCLDIGDPYVIGVCDQLQPTIFFDLKGCDITETAILQVGEEFDSYLWNTGSTRSFIEVSATEPFTYRVTVTLDNGCIGIGTQPIRGDEISIIGDFVWEDSDGDGRQGADEEGINGVTVNLFADFDNNGRPDFPNFPSCITTTVDHPDTGEPGYYEFTVYQSSYVVGFEAPTGFVTTAQNQGDEVRDSDINEDGLTGRIAVARNVVIDNVDAGFRTSTGVGGLVWEDIDGDGRRDDEEVGLNDIMLNLYNLDDELIATTVTLTDPESGEEGTYCFDNVAVLDYYVEIVLPDERALSEPNIGADDTKDSDATGENGVGTTGTVTTDPGVKTLNVDFGTYIGGRVCGIVWQENLEGQGTENVYDPDVDSLIANSQVALIDPATSFVVQLTSTDSDGSYCLLGIPVGSYRVVFGASGSGMDFVQQNQGDDPLRDSDVNVNFGATDIFFVAPMDTILGVNAGLRLEALPIELVSFSGNWDIATRANILDWTTITEINNDRFDIQRVLNNDNDFKTIGSIGGSGTTSDLVNYTYVDHDIQEGGTYYYRLKQVDYNGGFDYSDIVAIDVSLANSVGIKVYPNPVKDLAQLELIMDDESTLSVSVTDLLGRTIINSTDVHVQRGLNQINLNTASIPSGTYLVSLTVGGQQNYEVINITR